MASDSFEDQIKLRREQETAKTSETLKEIDSKLDERKAAAVARDAARREKLNESETRMVSKSAITKAISNTKLASVFFQKNDFLDNNDSIPAYVMDFVVKVAETVTQAESLNDPEFSGERFFDVLLDGYRRVPKLCMEALWLALNVEAFIDRVTGWPDNKRVEMKMRALSGSMGKGILSANHLIKSEILKIRGGAGRLHEGPLFQELNALFKERGERYDERLRLALRMSWMFSYAEMARADIPERYRLNMDAIDDVTLLLNVIIAETAMERHPYGPNKRRQTLSERDRVSEIVKNTGIGLSFRKSAVTQWLRAHDGLESIDLTYFPTEISIIEKEGLSEYSQTLLDCVTAVFPEASQINAPLFTEVLKKLLTAQFSVKKKFTMKLAPAPGSLSVKILDHDGETVIRELNIPNKTSATPAQQVNGAAPALSVNPSPVAAQPVVMAPVATPLPMLQTAPTKKRRLDLDI